MLSRRALLGASGIAAVGAALVAGDHGEARSSPSAPTAASLSGSGSGVRATGAHQAGIARPRTAQSNLLIGVYDLEGEPASVLSALGATILDLTGGKDPALAGLAVGDLTITVGVGPRLVAAAQPHAPGAVPLPAFPREEIDDVHRGGDLVIQVCASDPLVPPLVLAHLLTTAPALREKWRQRGIRGPATAVTETHTAPRNVLGFVDGIAVPVTKSDLADSVWIDEGPAAGGTIMVVRRMVIDLPSFRTRSITAQEAVIGRRRSSGAPLSGGGIAADVDLQAKTADGRYVIPLDAHARRAHPGPSGVHLMLRRSYSMDDPMGLLFISMQSELRTFTRTLERMSESDALLAFTRTTASGSFLLLPGFDRARPLGSTIFVRA